MCDILFLVIYPIYLYMEIDSNIHCLIVEDTTLDGLDPELTGQMSLNTVGLFWLKSTDLLRPFSVRRVMTPIYKDSLIISDAEDPRYSFEAGLMHSDPSLIELLKLKGLIDPYQADLFNTLASEVDYFPTITFSLRNKLPGDTSARAGMNPGLFVDYAFMVFEEWGYVDNTSIAYVLSNITEGDSVFFPKYSSQVKAGVPRIEALQSLWPSRKYAEHGFDWVFDIREKTVFNPRKGEEVISLISRHCRIESTALIREIVLNESVA